MRLALYYIKHYYEKYRLLVFIIFICALLIVSFLMIKKILIDFPNKTSDNYYLSLSQLYGGILGGLLTITGVSATIFYTNSVRREDMIASDKPVLLFDRKSESIDLIKIILEPIYEADNRLLFRKNELDNNAHYFSLKPFSLYVTSNADCILEGIIYGMEMIYPLKHTIILKKDKTYTIDLSDYYFACIEKLVPEITLIVISMNERKYYYTMIGAEEKGKDENLYSVKFDDIGERINGYNKKIDKLFNELDYKSDVYLFKKIKAKHEE